jgi:hypothetical protein
MFACFLDFQDMIGEIVSNDQIACKMGMAYVGGLDHPHHWN